MVVTYWSGPEGLSICAKCGAAVLDMAKFLNIHDNWHRIVDQIKDELEEGEPQ